jgi:hypothetical protein
MARATSCPPRLRLLSEGTDSQPIVAPVYHVRQPTRRSAHGNRRRRTARFCVHRRPPEQAVYSPPACLPLVLGRGSVAISAPRGNRVLVQLRLVILALSVPKPHAGRVRSP